TLTCNVKRIEMTSRKFFASITAEEDKPFDFLRALYDWYVSLCYVFLEGSIAGAAAGVIAEAVLYPIDTIKTRLQVAHVSGKIILKDLYSGLNGNLIGSLPAYAVRVGVYEPTKQTLLTSLPEKFSALVHLTAGIIGGAASSLICVPTEVVKQRMQTGQFASAPDAVRLIIAKEGFKGLYAGYGSFLLRDLPFDAIQFCMYEQLRIGYKIAARRELNDLETAMIGAFAGAITGAITTPLDVIKTRLMVQGSTKQHRGICDCVGSTMREEGSHIFFKHLNLRPGFFAVNWITVKSQLALLIDGHGTFTCNVKRIKMTSRKFFASITAEEDKPFDFLRALYEGSIAGAAAGVIVEAVLYPIDTIKTRLQVAHVGGKIILKDLYSGLNGILLVLYRVYEPAKQALLTSLPEKFSALAHLTAGIIGGAASSLIRVPTEVVKQRMQTGQFASAPNAVRLIIAKEGFKGLYAGYGSFLLRDLPFDAIQFCMYEQLRIGYKIAVRGNEICGWRIFPNCYFSAFPSFLEDNPLARRELNDLETAMIGAFAGAITGAITTPLDVIKTRLMVQVQIITSLRIIYSNGTAPRVLWIGIGGSIFFGVLERTKQLLAKRRPIDMEKSSLLEQDSKL
ncbi:hypothetical protein F8388_000947, partial [Cannabis sativa]